MQESTERQPFEVTAAYALGLGLPLIEAARRRTDFSDLPAYVDDFIAGALLLVAARAVTRGRPYGRALLAAAWGVLCGGGWYSIFGQLASTTAYDISGLPNGVVVAIKLVIYGVALTSLVLTVRRTPHD
jgi:hypothetical protein